MVQSRSMTRGNTRAALSRLRENIKSTNPIIAATMRNAVPRDGRKPTGDELTAGTARSYIQPHKLERISNIIANNIHAATDLRTITPYIDRAELIWSSLLLYPNGKQKTILDYTTRSTRFKNTPLHTALLKVWKDYFTNDYKIEDQLKEQCNDMLFNTGSYATLTMSRISLDYLINGMEMVNREGNEHLNPIDIYQRTQGNFTFDKHDKKLKVMNIGNYVRPPDDTSNDVFNVSGLESLQSSYVTSNQTEFDILKGTKLAGTKFEITLTDNAAILASNLLSEKRKQFNSKYYSGNEDLSSIIQGTLKDAAKSGPTAPADDKSKPNGPKQPKAKTSNLSMTELNNLQNDIFPQRRAANMFIQFVKQDIDFGVENYGTPIDFHVPSAAIIPIHINGNVKKKKDYLILIDPHTGDFLNPAADFQYYQGSEMNATAGDSKNAQGSTNALIDNLKQIQQGKDCTFDMTEFAELSKSIIIEQFMKSIISGRANNISLDLDEETNKIFLARMLRGQGIRCLYVPGENVTYAAFKYNALGTGQSLTQQAKMHIARLAAIDLADAMANMEAAQSTNKMRITVDKDDPTPERTIAMARDVFFRANPRFYNVLASSQMSIPVLVDAFKELSLTLEVDAAENPYLPTPQVEVSPMPRENFRRIDPDSRNEILNKISNFFMMPKSWLDVADDNNNFQIEALQEHRLVYNQALNWQEELAGFIMERELKHVRANKPFMITLIQVINENKKEWRSDNNEDVPGRNDAEKLELILEDFLNSIEANLPTPAIMENANKIKDSLTTANDLVTQWMEGSGKKELFEKALTSLNLTGEYDAQQVEILIKAYLIQKAHKMLNIPSPFEDAVDDPSGGGIASVVGNIVLQNKSTYAFLTELAIQDLEQRTKMRKDSEKKIEKALSKWQTVGGDDETNPEGQTSEVPNPFDSETQGNTEETPINEQPPEGESGTPPEDEQGNDTGDNPPEDDDTNTLSDNPEGPKDPFA